MLSLLPFKRRDIKDKPKQREVQNGRELPEYQLSSGVFQRLTSRTSVPRGGLNNVNSFEPAENITCYPRIVFQVEEARQCSFLA
jgi:hypothetical protein